MRAMICRQWGGPEDLRLEEVESPPLKSGQVRIRIRAAGVSFATTLVIAGKCPINRVLLGEIEIAERVERV